MITLSSFAARALAEPVAASAVVAAEAARKCRRFMVGGLRAMVAVNPASLSG